MIPNIFVSSTIQDLQHLRDGIRETVLELGYNPVMSDYGDIGYLPMTTAEESCYLTMRDCHLAILIIGKRYGSVSANGLSVTHNEFHTARENSVPLISLVDREVISFKTIFDANISTGVDTVFPGMDSPKLTFKLIQDIMESRINNGILGFNTVADVRLNLKKQIAHLFGNLLSSRFDPIKLQLQDVLSEIKTLRHELLKDRGPEPIRYLNAMNFLLDEREYHREYRRLAKQLTGSLEKAIPIMLESNTFDEFLERTDTTLEIADNPIHNASQSSGLRLGMTSTSLAPDGLPQYEDEDNGAEWVVYVGRIIMNPKAKKYFDFMHSKFREEAVG